jgi:hypothetical protein
MLPAPRLMVAPDISISLGSADHATQEQPNCRDTPVTLVRVTKFRLAHGQGLVFLLPGATVGDAAAISKRELSCALVV